MDSQKLKGVLPTPPPSRPLSPKALVYSLPAIQTPVGLIPDSIESHLMTLQDNLLIVSPYTTALHLLDLGTISEPNRLLAKALTLFKQVRHDYATAPYAESFNWAHVIGFLRTLVEAECTYDWEQQSFYIIVFRSQLPPATDRTHLAKLDRLSHAEAMESGGLLKYWFGVPDANGRNLATCQSI